MNRILVASAFAGGLFVGIVILLELGRRLGQRSQAEGADSARAGLGAVEGAVFALLGLMIAFTFSGAASRFDARRELIVDEANAIGTAWLRLDLLPSAVQPELRELFRNYLDSRLLAYQKLPDITAAQTELANANAIQSRIWAKTMAVCKETPSPLQVPLIVALNEMFDIATSRFMASMMHPPALIFIMLGVLALTSALLAGHAMAPGRSRSWLHMLGFALIVSITVYMILDMEYPRLGLMRVDSFDKVLVDLRQTMR